MMMKRCFLFSRQGKFNTSNANHQRRYVVLKVLFPLPTTVEKFNLTLGLPEDRENFKLRVNSEEHRAHLYPSLCCVYKLNEETFTLLLEK